MAALALWTLACLASLGCAQQPADDNSTRISDFPKLAETPLPPASTLGELTYTFTHDGAVALAHDSYTSAFARGVYRGYEVVVRHDAIDLTVTAEAMEANSTFRFRSFGYNETRWSWVNETYNATTNVTSYETINEVIKEYITEGTAGRWITGTLNATGNKSLPGAWWSATLGLVPLSRFNVTTVEVEITSGTDSSWANQTYQIAVTRNESLTYGCPGATSSDYGCISHLSNVSAVPAILTQRQTAAVVVTGYDNQGRKREYGGEAAGILATIKKLDGGNDVQTATVEDLGTGNYVVSFAPGRAGRYRFSAAFWGDDGSYATDAHYSEFWVNPKTALDTDFTVLPDADKVALGASTGVVNAGHILDFIVTSSPTLPSDLETNAAIAADAQYFGANCASETFDECDRRWLATAGYYDIHGTYVEPTPDPLGITRDALRRERYFWFSATLAGRYKINVRLGQDHLGGSTYEIRVAGGAAVNHVFANASSDIKRRRGGVGLASLPYAYDGGDGAPPAAEDQLGAWTAAATTFVAGDELAIDFDFRDAYGNVAEIDHDDVELLVKFTNTAVSRRAGAGEVVTASAARVLEARVAGYGHRATATLPRAGTYDVTATLGGVPVCVKFNASDSSATTCIPPVVIETGPAQASASIVLGTATLPERAANAATALVVVPVDGARNAIGGDDGNAYSVVVECVSTADATLIAVGAKPENGTVAAYDTDADDGSFAFDLDPLKFAGRYNFTVTQTAPAATGGVVATFLVTVVPGEPSEIVFDLTFGAASESVAVGDDGTMAFGVYDAHGNLVTTDLSDSMLATMVPDDANVVRRFFSSDPDVGASFGPLRVTRDATDDTYALAFNVPVAGTYAVSSVSIEGVSIPAASTFNLVASPGSAVAATTTALGGGARRAVAGASTTFPVHVADRYGNLLVVEESGLQFIVNASIVTGGSDATCESGRVTAIADAAAAWNALNKRYEATYKSDVSGTLSVRVALRGGDESDMGFISGSPFFVAVEPAATDASASTLTVTSTRETVGAPATFFVRAKDAYGNARGVGGDSFFVAVVDAAGVVVAPSVTLTDNGDGSYTGVWTPTAAASTYEIRVLLAGTHVFGSPKLNVEAVASSAVGAFDAAAAETDGDGLRSATAGVVATFTVYANDANGARLHAGGVAFDATLTPSGTTGGSAIAFTRLQSTDAGASGETLSAGEGVVVDRADGTYDAYYKVEYSGTYDLDVQVGGASINGFSTAMAVTAYAGVTVASKTIMQVQTDPHVFPSSSTAGATVTTRVTSLDALGNKRCYADAGDGADYFEVSVTVDGVEVSASDVSLNQTQIKASGVVDVALTPKTAGTHVVSVRLHGEHVFGSPATVAVSAAAADAGTSGAMLAGDALFGGRVGVQRTASLSARDAHGNLVTGSGLSDATCGATLAAEFTVVNASGNAVDANATAACVLTSAEDGVFEVSVTAYDAGAYTLEVTIDGTVAARFDGVTFVASRSDAAASAAAGAGVAAVASGAQGAFTVTARDEFGNDRGVDGDDVAVRVAASSTLGTPESYGLVVDNLNGTYAVTYDAPAAVGAFDLEVTLGGEPVAGSPFSVNATRAATDGSLSYVRGGAASVVGVAGATNWFVIVPVNVHGAPQPEDDAETSGDVFDLAVSPADDSYGAFPDGAVAEKVAASAGGGFNVTWRADRVLYDSDGTLLNYTLNVTFGGAHILGSPFSAPLVAGSINAANSVTFSTSGSMVPHAIIGADPLGVTAGADSLFVFQTRDSWNNDASYDPFQPVTLRVSLRATPDADLPEAKRPNVANRDLDDGDVQSVDVAVRNLLDGTYRLSFVATVAGTYDLWLELDGEKVGPNLDALGNAIASTPMRLEIMPGPLSPAHFKVFGAGVEFPAAVNEINVMRIQTRDAFGNDRVDDGDLLTLERRMIRDEHSTINMRPTIAGYVFDVAVEVCVGEKWESTTQTYAAEYVNVSFVPLGGVEVNAGERFADGTFSGQRYTDGTYAVNFRVAHAGTTVSKLRLNQTYETREISTNRILNVNVTHVVGSVALNAGESFFEQVTGRTAATRAVFSGYGTEDGAAARVDLPVIVTPLDDDGNVAIVDEPSRLSLYVSPESRAKLVDEGVFVGPAEDGTFTALWRGVAPGSVDVEIFFDGVHLPGSPKQISMLINPLYMNINPLLSNAEGPALLGATAGNPSVFTVRLVTDSGAGYPTSADYRWDGSSPCVAGGVALGYVNVTLDGAPLSATNEHGRVVDNCDGTYDAEVTQFVSGYHTFYVSMGPDDENLNFVDGEIRGVGGFGANAGFYEVLVYSGPTADVDVEYLGKAAEGVARVGETLKLNVYPKDAHGNKQDYHVFEEDGLRVVATVNRLYDSEFVLTPNVDDSTIPPTVWYEARFVPTEAGAYVVRVDFLGQDGQVTESSAGSKEINLLASTASRATSVVSGQGVSMAKTGAKSYFRVELKDAHGNYAGDGSFVDPEDALSLPEHRMTYVDDLLVPVILEARLVPHGSNWTAATVEASLAYDPYQGVYIGEYVATSPGRHDLQVLLHGQLVTHGASYLGTEVVVGEADTAQSVAKSPNLEGFDESLVNVSAVPAAAGDDVAVKVEARDANGNPLDTGGASFVVLARAVEGTYDPTTIASGTQARVVVAAPAPEDRRDGRYVTAFAPTVAATWSVFVTRGGVAVRGSPYLMTVIPGVTSAAHSLLACGDAAVVAGTARANCPLLSSGSVAGSTAPFYAVAKDAWNNTNALVTAMDGDAFYFSAIGSLDAMAVNSWAPAAAVLDADGAGSGWYGGSFDTNVTGDVTVRLTLGEELVAERVVRVAPGAISPSKCVAVSAGVPTATAGEAYAVHLTARDAFGNDLVSGGEALTMNVSRVGAEVTDASNVAVALVDNDDGTYSGSFVVEKTGDFSFTPFGDASLAGFTVTKFSVVAAARSLPRTTARGSATYVPGPFVAGVAGTFFLTFHDRFDNVRYDSGGLTNGTLTLTVTSPDGDETVVSYADNYADGTFEITFTSNVTGTLAIAFVDDEGKSLVNAATNRPYVAVVSPASVDASKTELFGAGASNAAAGRTNAAHVRFFDAFDNEFRDAALDSDSNVVLAFSATPGSEANAPSDAALAAITQSLEYHGQGVYTVYYTPPASTSAASYYLRVVAVVDGVSVAASAADVLVSLATDANPFKTTALDSRLAEIDVTDLNAYPLSGGRFVAGVAAEIVVEVRDDSGAAVGAPSADYVRVAATPLLTTSVALTSEGRVAIAFEARTAGVYSLVIEAGGPADTDFVAIGGNWASVSETTRGEILIEVISANAVAAPAASATAIEALPGDAFAKTSSAPIAYADDYDVNATFLVVVAGVRSALRVRSVDGEGNDARYLAAFGPETYSATLTGVNGTSSSDVVFDASLENAEDGSYELVFEATTSGDYVLDSALGTSSVTRLSGETVVVVPGEVFPPVTTFAPSFAEGGPTPEGGSPAGTPVAFVVEARDHFGNLHVDGDEGFELSVTAPSGAVAVRFAAEGGAAAVTANADATTTATKTLPLATDGVNGTYAASFTPYTAGAYVVDLKHAGSGVEAMDARALTVTPGPPDASRLETAGKGAHGGVADSRISFLATAQDAYGNDVVDGGALVSALTFEIFESVDASGTKPDVDSGGLDAGAGLLFASTEDVTDASASPARATVRATYSLSEVGTYWLAPRVFGTLAHGAPFRLVIVPRPAPVAASAAVADDLTRVEVVFDVDTDRARGARAGGGGDSRNTSCATYFDDATVVKLGGSAESASALGVSPPACAWSDDKTLAVYFGSRASAVPGDALAFRSDVVRNKAENAFNVSGSVSITAPSNPVLPSAALSAADTIGPCDGATLDASASVGGGGRPLAYAFSVSADATDGYAVTKALDDAAAAAAAANPGNPGASYPVVRLSSAELDPGVVYEFTAKVTDFVGNSATSTISVNKTMYPIPNARITGVSGVGNVRLARRADDLTIEAEAHLPSHACGALRQDEVGDSLTYSWQLVDGPVLAASDFPSESLRETHQRTLSSRNLFIPRRTLRAGETYRWRLRTSLAINPVRFFSDSFAVIQATSSPIEAGAESGVNRALFQDSPVVLRVNPFDPDDARDANGTPYPFTVRWSCSVSFSEDDSYNTTSSTLTTSATTCGDHIVGGFPSSYLDGAKEVIFPPGVLTTGATYLFGVSVSKEPLVTNSGAARSKTLEMRVTVLRRPDHVRVRVNETTGLIDEKGALPSLRALGPKSGSASVSERVALKAAVSGCNARFETDSDGVEKRAGFAGFDFLNANGTVVDGFEVASVNALNALNPHNTSSNYTCLGVTWSCVAGDLSFFDANALAAVAETPLMNDALVLKPGALTPGTKYTFRATATGAAASGLFADVDVYANSAPRGGRLVAAEALEETASAAQRAARRDMGYGRFALRALDFADRAEDYPLTYSFHLVTTVGGVETLTPLGATQSSNALETTLPAGDNEVLVRVTDNKGATSDAARATVTAIAAPPPSPPPPPSPSPPPFGGNAPDRRRRALLQVAENTDASAPSSVYDKMEADDFIAGFVAPSTGVADHARLARAAALYAELSWRAETPGVAVRGGCSVGLDALAEPHATVAVVLGAARDATVRTAPGVEQSLCAAASLSGDPRMVSAAAFDALAKTLREDAAFAFAERERAVLTEAATRCALTLASNLVAVARSGCFLMTKADLDAFGRGVVEATSRAADAHARSLVPGAADARVRGFSFRASGIALDALALDASVAVGGGFPATLVIDDGVAFDAKTFASVTVDADPDAIGEAFLKTSGDSPAAAFLTSFKGVAANPVDGTLSFDTETFFDAGFAPSNAWFHDAEERLASDLTALRLEALEAPEQGYGAPATNATSATAALLAAVRGVNVTLGFDVSLKPANKFGRVATVRYFDASVAAVSAVNERAKAENQELLADAADRWAEYQIANPVVNGSFANGTNVTWPPPPAPSPPPPRFDLPPAPREGTGVPLGTGWVDHTLVEGSIFEIGGDPATNTLTAARFAPLPYSTTLFAALLTNAAAPPPPSPPPPPLPPPFPPPPLPPPAPSPPKPKSYTLEIILGSVFGSLFVLGALLYAYITKKTNPSAGNRYREYIEKRKNELKNKAALKKKMEADKAADMWELYRREKNRQTVLNWAKKKFKGKFGPGGGKIDAAEKTEKPPRASEAPRGAPLIFGGGKVYPGK